jgi:hypothetical protein
MEFEHRDEWRMRDTDTFTQHNPNITTYPNAAPGHTYAGDTYANAAGANADTYSNTAAGHTYTNAAGPDTNPHSNPSRASPQPFDPDARSDRR